MAKARVELIRGRTLSARGRTLVKGQPQIITDVADILYYKGISSVSVRDMEVKVEPPPEKKVEPKPVIVAPVAEEPTELDEPEEEDVEENPVEETKEAATKYSLDELKEMKKSKLIEVATALGIIVEAGDKKKRIIAEIVDVQNAEE